MAAEGTLTGIRGWLIDAPDYGGKVRARTDGALIIDDGEIAEVGDYDTLSKKPREQRVRWQHSNRVAVFPGLIRSEEHTSELQSPC